MWSNDRFSSIKTTMCSIGASSSRARCQEAGSVVAAVIGRVYAGLSSAAPVYTGAISGRGHDAELLDEREEGRREGRVGCPLPHLLPVDLLAQGARDLKAAAEVRLLLGEREELRDHDVLERRDRHRQREHLERLRAVEQLVVDGPARRVEDQVDEHVAVVSLQEPVLERPLRPEPGLAESLQRALRVLRLDEQVDVVLGLRAAAGPRREAAAERVVD